MTRNHSSWLKDNLFVVAALALPLIVIAFFLAATGIPRFLVDDPQHDFLFVFDHYENQEYALRYRLVDGRLVADVRLTSAIASWPNQKLYRFNASTLNVDKIEPKVPDSVRQRLHENTATRTEPPQPGTPVPVQRRDYPGETFDVTETATLQLLQGTIAPDDYEFRNEFSGGPGLFGELFGMGSRRSGISITRNGRVISLTMPDMNGYRYYYNATLLGWVAQ